MHTTKKKLTRQLTDASRCIFAIIEYQFSDQCISRAQYQYVMRIDENPGCSQDDLAKMLKFKQAIVSKTITALENSGLVIRVKTEQDRRICQLYLTETGKKISGKLKKTTAKLNETCIAGIDEKELSQFCETLLKISHNLEAEYTSCKGKCAQQPRN